MSIHDKTEALRAVVKAFVIDQLKGRFREFVSDDYLASHLLSLLKHICYHRDDPADSRGRIAFEEREQEAYRAGVRVFEVILEGELRAGGNGHHVAQAFGKAIKAFRFQNTSQTTL